MGAYKWNIAYEELMTLPLLSFQPYYDQVEHINCLYSTLSDHWQGMSASERQRSAGTMQSMTNKYLMVMIYLESQDLTLTNMQPCAHRSSSWDDQVA